MDYKSEDMWRSLLRRRSLKRVEHLPVHCDSNEEGIMMNIYSLFLTIDSSSLHLIDNFFNLALSLSNSADNSRFFLESSTTFVAMASPPMVFAPAMTNDG